MADLTLGYAFPDQSETFVLGFEAGGVHERLKAGELVDTREGFPLHAENAEVLGRMAAFYGLSLVLESCDTEGWINAVFSRRKSALHLLETSRP